MAKKKRRRKNKINKPGEPKFELLLQYREDRRGGYPISDGAYSDRDDENISFKPEGLFTDREKMSHWEIKTLYVSEAVYDDIIAGGLGYLVVVRYEDGDSFGRSYGHWHIAGVYSTEGDAREAKSNAHNSKYAPWKGYFARYTNTEIYGVPYGRASPENGSGIIYV